MKKQLQKLEWSAQEFASFGQIPQVSRHSYDELSLFNNDTLADLLDRHPREGVLAHFSCDDPTDNFDWKAVNVLPELSGREILQAVGKSRLWTNVIHLGKYHPEYVELIEDIYSVR